MFEYIYGVFIILIGVMTAFSGWTQIKHCIDLSGKTEGKFIKMERVDDGHRTYYYLFFSYYVDGREIRTSADNTYGEFLIKRRFRVGQTYPIYYDPKNPRDFQTKRFSGMFLSIFIFFIGISFIIVALKECFHIL